MQLDSAFRSTPSSVYSDISALAFRIPSEPSFDILGTSSQLYNMYFILNQLMTQIFHQISKLDSSITWIDEWKKQHAKDLAFFDDMTASLKKLRQ